MAQLSYGYMSEVPALPGMLANEMAVTKGAIISRTNNGGQAKQTIGTITIGGSFSAAETVSVQIVGTSPTSGGFDKTFTATADADATVTELAEDLVAEINADEDVNDVLVASNAAGVITLTVRYFNVDVVTSVAGSESSASGTITASPTITAHADAAAIPFGYVVGCYTASQNLNEDCSKITTASGLTVLGIAKESKAIEAEYPFSRTAVSSYPANRTVEVVRMGTKAQIWVPCAAAVVVGTEPHFLNATGQVTTDGASSSTALTGALCLAYDAATGLALLEV